MVDRLGASGATLLDGRRARVRGGVAALVGAALAALLLAPPLSGKPPGKDVGQSCNVDTDCATGLCGPWDPGTRACLPPPRSVPLGGLCSTNEHCQGVESYCKSHRCERPLELGEPCTGNESCRSRYCDEGLGSGGTKKCVPAAGTGRAGDYCSQEAHCQSKLCTATQCEAQRAPGGVCRKDANCASSVCEGGSTLGAGQDGKCVPAAKAGTAGQYCSKHSQCVANYCSNHACAAIAGLGEACPGGDAQCASRFCDAGAGSGGTNKCVPAAGTGQAGNYCSQDAHCALRMCIAHQCAAKAGLGESCPRGNMQCQSGFCDAGAGSGGTNKCVPAAGTGLTGQYCSQNGHCKPGKACSAHRCQ